MNPWHKQAIALAGLAQAVDLMDKLAKTGHLDSSLFEISVKSLFITAPDSVTDVYDGPAQLTQGFEVLAGLLEKGQAGSSAHLITYGLGLLHLQKKLSKDGRMLHIISTGLEQAKSQSEHFGITHENVIANLADTYSKTLSQFTFRIQVSGDQRYLQQARVANQIRVLLLAGIRAAILWRQSGGNRWTLLFKRAALLSATKELISEAKNQTTNS